MPLDAEMDNQSDDGADDYSDEAFGIGDQGPKYTPDKILGMVKGWDRECNLGWANWRSEARVMFGAVAGDPWDPDDKADLIDALRVPVVFNRVEPTIDAVSGAQIANRQEMAFFAREVGDAQASELIGAAIDADRDACSADDEESEAAKDALICGLGWIEERLEHENDPKGELVWEQIDVFEMAGDPYAKKKNLNDGRYVRRTRELSPEEFREFKETIGELGQAQDYGADDETSRSDDGYEGGVKNNEPHDAYQDDDDDDSLDGNPRKTYTVREYQWSARHVTEESDWRVADPITGQSAVLKADQYRKLAMQFKMRGITLQGRPLKQKCIYRAYVCGNKVLGVGAHRLPGITSFTYKAITGKRDKKNKTWYGLVRTMMDPQRFVNALFSQILHIIDSSAKGGVYYEEGAILDIEDFEDKHAQVDANIAVADGAIADGRIKPRTEMNFPVGYDKLLGFVWESFPWVTGVTPNLLGMFAESGESGILDAQRTRQAYGVLQWFFASIRRYHIEGGRLALELLAHVDQGKLVRIVRADQRQYVPLAYDGDVARYDIVVDESADSPSQQDQVFAVMMQIAPLLKNVGLPPEALAEFIRYSPLPATMKEKFAASISQPTPEKQKAAQMAEADAVSKIKKQNADAMLSEAKAKSEEFEPALRAQEMALKKGEQQLQKLEIMARMKEIDATAKQNDQKAQHEFQKAQLDLEGKRSDVRKQRIALEQARVAAMTPAAKVAVSSDTSGLEGSIAKLVEQVAAQSAAVAQGMARIGEEMGAEKELVRDEGGRAVGVRRRASPPKAA